MKRPSSLPSILPSPLMSSWPPITSTVLSGRVISKLKVCVVSGVACLVTVIDAGYMTAALDSERSWLPTLSLVLGSLSRNFVSRMW